MNGMTFGAYLCLAFLFLGCDARNERDDVHVERDVTFQMKDLFLDLELFRSAFERMPSKSMDPSTLDPRLLNSVPEEFTHLLGWKPEVLRISAGIPEVHLGGKGYTIELNLPPDPNYNFPKYGKNATKASNTIFLVQVARKSGFPLLATNPIFAFSESPTVDAHKIDLPAHTFCVVTDDGRLFILKSDIPKQSLQLLFDWSPEKSEVRYEMLQSLSL